MKLLDLAEDTFFTIVGDKSNTILRLERIDGMFSVCWDEQETKELLAQPEQNNTQYLLDQVARLTAENAMLKEKWLAQPEQEPVVWQVIGIAGFMYVYNKPIDEVYEHHTVNALYLAPPQREPLSEDEIVALWANKSPANEFECVRLVEKAHGIGGE